jgi:hypothetical protein
MQAVDVSNHQGALSVATLRTWKDEHDVGLLIVQAVDPSPPWPRSQTRQQIEAAHQAGMAVDAYLWLWTLSDVARDMRNKLALLDGLEVGRLWLDVEDTESAAVSRRLEAVHQALPELDAWSSARGLPAPGIYTGGWYWKGYMGNTREHAERDLWDADYRGQHSTFASYGGWTRRAIHQYTGDGRLPGHSGALDLNTVSALEALRLTPEDEMPVPQEYQDKFGCGPKDWDCVVANLEGIIRSLQNQQPTLADPDAAKRLAEIREIVLR